MSKKNNIVPTGDTETLKHNPFAGLVALKRDLDPPAHADKSPVAPVPRVKPGTPVKAKPAPKLSLRHETKGRAGKAITRISGLPQDNLEAIASSLRRALGCGATVEDGDVILLGMLAERATTWLEHAGDLRTIETERPRAILPETANAECASTAAEVATNSSSGRAGTNRRDIRPGQRVAVVMKADQSSGRLTEGIVRDLLTNSPTHPRGIKVRLQSGEVGRVKLVLG